jgi:polysaccharide export outer membrane protein
MKLGACAGDTKVRMAPRVYTTLLLACLTVAPVAFAQEPSPRGSTGAPATLEATPPSTESAPAAATADATTAAATASAPAAPSDTPPNLPIVAAPTPTPVMTPLDLASAYQIGPEDVLEISVWKNPELSRTVPVRPDGKVSLPLVNDIQASGLTPIDLRDQVTAKLSEYIPAPEVSVIVREVHSRKVTVTGAVKLPGRYEMKSALTVLEVIALAQGLTDFASKDRIVVLRQNGQKTERIPFNYRKISDSAQQDNFLVRPGDIVFVP